VRQGLYMNNGGIRLPRARFTPVHVAAVCLTLLGVPCTSVSAQEEGVGSGTVGNFPLKHWAWTEGLGGAALHFFEPALRFRPGLAVLRQEDDASEYYDARIWAHIPLFDNLEAAISRPDTEYPAPHRRDIRWALAFYVHFEAHLRQRSSDSSPVETPGYRPGATLSLFHISPVQNGWSLVSRLGGGFSHYSNGQDGCIYNSGATSSAACDAVAPICGTEPTCSIEPDAATQSRSWNLDSGSFSTNYFSVELDTRLSLVDPRTKRERAAFQLGATFRRHVLENSDPSDVVARQLYGGMEFGLSLELWMDAHIGGIPNEQSDRVLRSVERWGRLGFTADVWLYGDDETPSVLIPAVSTVPWHAHLEASWTFQKVNGLGFGVYYEGGRDPLNAQFLNGMAHRGGFTAIYTGRPLLWFR
jgi:hypothetical protein